MPNWGADLSDLDFDNLYYYARPQEQQSRSWEDVPANIKETFERIGIPEAERKFLAGVGAQYDSEMVYHSIKEDLTKKGVIFTDPETAVREHPDLVKQYFGTVIPYLDNKFAALNSAVWSGGSFVYVPKGVKVDVPLQAYFRINAKSFGQFERTLIIADEGSFVHYIEGCTAPIYATESLHSAVVEIIALPGARVRYTTIQNWSNDVYNLVTKRAVAHKDAIVEWVDGNIGAKRTMKYPSIYLMGEGAHGEVLSIAFAGKGQEQDTGGKAVHAASHTSSVDHGQVHQQGRRDRQLPRPSQGERGPARRALPRGLRRADPGRAVPQQHLPVHGDRLRRRVHRARGPGEQDQRGAALLPDEPGDERAGGLPHDRERLPRSPGEAASHGVRGGAEPAHRAGDGRHGGMMAERREPAWMRTLRAQARERFDAMALAHHLGRGVAAHGREPARTALSYAAGPARAKAACPREADAGRMRRGHPVRGRPVRRGRRWPTQWQKRGVRLLPLDARAGGVRDAAVPTCSMRRIDEADNRFLAWHYAAWSHGAFLWVPAGPGDRRAVPHRFRRSAARESSARRTSR